MPNVNLVSNIGFGELSTHTNDNNNVLANIPSKPIWPINHPDLISINKEADIYSFDFLYRKSIIRILYRIVFRFIK